VQLFSSLNFTFSVNKVYKAYKVFNTAGLYCPYMDCSTTNGGNYICTLLIHRFV